MKEDLFTTIILVIFLQNIILFIFKYDCLLHILYIRVCVLTSRTEVSTTPQSFSVETTTKRTVLNETHLFFSSVGPVASFFFNFLFSSDLGDFTSSYPLYGTAQHVICSIALRFVQSKSRKKPIIIHIFVRHVVQQKIRIRFHE